MKASILICSLNREESLGRLLRSLKDQTVKGFEILVCRDKGNLVELKDKLWRQAKGDILVWMDDDIICRPSYMETLMWIFDHNRMVGYCTRVIVPSDKANNRDIYKFKMFHPIYNKLFLDGNLYSPCYISKCGVNSIGGGFGSVSSGAIICSQVDFLEPSAFALRKKAVEEVGGFDLGYKGVGEWCDVDLCYRVKKFGGLWYDGFNYVYHMPERDGIANQRLETKTRYENYCRFADKFIEKTPRHYLYRSFLKTYFWGKQKGWF
ncbi:MAG TPA: hypothetical protein P5110_06845 [Candidatus Omnitrophota bacterium]|nr:hypothetical protein [Candidatus Omnitrophota bacterium]